MSKLAGFGAHAAVRVGDEFTMDVNHVRVVTASSVYPAPDPLPDRISLGGIAGYAVTRHLRDPVTELNHCRVVTATLDRYRLNCKLSLMENFHLMVMGNWNSVEELLSPESYVVAEITDIAPGVVAGADTKVLLEFTDAAPGIGDMEFYYSRSGQSELTQSVEINTADLEHTKLWIKKQLSLFKELEFYVDLDSVCLVITSDTLLFKAGYKFVLKNPVYVNRPAPPIAIGEDDAFAKQILRLDPIRYYPIHAAETNTVHDYSDYRVHGTLSQLSAVSAEAPIRKNQPASKGFNITQHSTAQVTAPVTGDVAGLFNYNRTGTLIYWIRSVISSTYNIHIAVSTNPSSGTSHWRMYNGHAHMPDNKNTVQIPGYTNGDNKIYMIAVRRSGPSNISVFANGQWRTTIGNPEATQPNAGATGQLAFPGFYSWNYYGVRGVVSDVAMFDRALTDTQIETLYNIGRLD